MRQEIPKTGNNELARQFLRELASLFDYPGEQSAEAIKRCMAAGEANGLDKGLLLPLQEYLSTVSVDKAQELFTSTFDMNAVCSLDIGYYLFGEDYQRGEFLARLRESQESLGLAQETELPDHLPVLLRWLAEVYGAEEHVDMARECLLPVLGKMEENFSGGANPYRFAIEAVRWSLMNGLVNLGLSTDPTVLRDTREAVEAYSGRPDMSTQKLIALEV